MRPPISLAIAALLAAPLLAATAAAQSAVRSDAPLLATAGGRTVATLRQGADVAVVTEQGEYAQITVDGWVAASLLGGARESFPASVRGSGGVRLRDSASTRAAIVAELRQGMGVNVLQRRGGWVQVRRTGWVRRGAIAAPAAPPSPSVAAAEGAQETTGTGAGPATPAVTEPAVAPTGELVASRTAGLATHPEGARIGTLGPGARVAPLARERGWVRVRVEGWVREEDMLPADSSLRAALSAADLRADPEGTRGRLVRWRVQIIKLQRADPLRKGLADGEPYLLARGPGDENALVYLAVPPSLLETARALAPLDGVLVTARVRDGRSEPVGVPILDLQTLVRD
jgi:hypothetical protein